MFGDTFVGGAVVLQCDGDDLPLARGEQRERVCGRASLTAQASGLRAPARSCAAPTADMRGISVAMRRSKPLVMLGWSSMLATRIVNAASQGYLDVNGGFGGRALVHMGVASEFACAVPDRFWHEVGATSRWTFVGECEAQGVVVTPQRKPCPARSGVAADVAQPLADQSNEVDRQAVASSVIPQRGSQRWSPRSSSSRRNSRPEMRGT